MTEPQPKFLTIAEKREWLAGIFRDTSGEYTDADKFKALREDTRLIELARLSTSKEQEEAEHGRMDYIDKRCHNCKHFHFENLRESWCSYHNEAVCTVGKPCLCWKLRKEME